MEYSLIVVKKHNEGQVQRFHFHEKKKEKQASPKLKLEMLKALIEEDWIVKYAGHLRDEPDAYNDVPYEEI